MEADIAINPKILFNPEIAAAEFKLYGIQLGDNAQKINQKKITGTGPVKPLVAFDSYLVDDSLNKVYLMQGGKEIEFRLHERIKAVEQFGGYLRIGNKCLYGIENGLVAEFVLLNDLKNEFKGIRDYDIEKKFGKADEITETFLDDVELFSSTVPEYYIYHKRQLKIKWSEGWKPGISSVSIGTQIEPDTNFNILGINGGIITYTYGKRL